ncbi:hypothetical protein [Streptomyces echinatus]|uniref:Uncharacterized protein n=1 Tax=Streptomyces echinatus TaxID=67293 RepID=A0A7W9Q2J1_9ACTN|nr:hypothetical protein [Streptomyces echinatus]MBB5932441.1 hypothetical protein [Streptomyces echinatus]
MKLLPNGVAPKERMAQKVRHQEQAGNQRHRGVHRYVYRLGRNRREREGMRLGLPAIGAFPKTPDGR